MSSFRFYNVNMVFILIVSSFILSISTFGQINSHENSSISNSIDCDDIKYLPGKSLRVKPSLSQRMGGCEKIYNLVPYQTSFIWNGLSYYLKDIGLNVVNVSSNFNNEIRQLGNTIGSYTFFIDNAPDYYMGSNDLAVILNLVEVNAPYSKTKYNIKLTFGDINGYTWLYELNFDKGISLSEYKNNLKRAVVSSVNRNSPAKVILPKKITCWNESKIKQYFKENGVDKFEGIYENSTKNYGSAKYKVAVKKISSNFYLIYLGGANNPQDWLEGEIKATLIPTATPLFFKAKWIMADKSENDEFYISFEQGLMNIIDHEQEKSLYIKMYPTSSDNIKSFADVPASGTGFAITSNGLIVTNHHVVNNTKTIKVRGVNNDFSRTYSAKLVISDKNNDLAIIKIDDYSFSSLGTIPYIVKTSVSNVGENIFVLGYPLRATMGDEVKLTNGIISSKTGFQGDVTSYQISAPVQPGNSGGPLFNSKGQLIGIINSKHLGAENASYAIKSSYLINLIDLLDYPPTLPNVNTVNGKPLTQQVQIINKFVYIIEVK